MSDSVHFLTVSVDFVPYGALPLSPKYIRSSPGRSFLTVELTEDKRGRVNIVQIHGYRNEGYASGEEKEAVRPSTRYKWFLDSWLGWVNAGSQRDKDGSPVLPGTDKTKEVAV